MCTNRYLAAKAAKELPKDTTAREVFDRVMAGEDIKMNGDDIVWAIRNGAAGVKKIAKIIYDPRFNNDWVIFLRDNNREITWDRIYSAGIYAPSFTRRIIAFAETSYRDHWKSEIQYGPEDIIKTLED